MELGTFCDVISKLNLSFLKRLASIMLVIYLPFCLLYRDLYPRSKCLPSYVMSRSRNALRDVPYTSFVLTRLAFWFLVSAFNPPRILITNGLWSNDLNHVENRPMRPWRCNGRGEGRVRSVKLIENCAISVTMERSSIPRYSDSRQTVLWQTFSVQKCRWVARALHSGLKLYEIDAFNS